MRIKYGPAGLLHGPAGVLFDRIYTIDSTGLRVAPPYRQDAWQERICSLAAPSLSAKASRTTRRCPTKSASNQGDGIGALISLSRPMARTKCWQPSNMASCAAWWTPLPHMHSTSPYRVMFGGWQDGLPGAVMRLAMCWTLTERYIRQGIWRP